MNFYRFSARASLILVMLVVLAGSVVRMSGSGMGCPDWPKCFGHYIPPTEESQVLWQSDQFYEEGQMIVYNEKLWVAKVDFISTTAINLGKNWQVYDKHDYALFNPVHTWIEYINRLIGVLAGFPVLLTALLSLGFLKNKWWLTVMSFSVLFLLGFEAWLGKVVVDGNLVPFQITLHMLGALLIALLLVAIISLTSKNKRIELPSKQRLFLLALTVLSIVQLILGTSVREDVDALLAGGVLRENVINSLPLLFKAHRSFSILIVLSNGYFILQAFRSGWLTTPMKLIGAFVFLEVVIGIILTYGGFPAPAQPIHLLLGFGLILSQAYSWFTSKQRIQ